MEKSIVKNSLTNIIYTILNMAMSLLLSAYVARILLAEGVGQVAYAQNITNYFCAFAEFGLMTYGVLEIARYRKSQSDINRIFTELFLINIVTTTCALITYLMFILLMGGVKEQKALLLASGVSIFFNYLNIDWFYYGEEEYVYIVTRNLVVQIFSLIAVFRFVRTSKDYIIYALILSLSKGSSCILGVIRARKYVRLDKKGLMVWKHVKTLMIIASYLILMTLYREVNVTMLGFLSTKTETGYYRYAFSAVNIIADICISVITVFSPRLSYYYKTNLEKFFQLLQLGIKVLIFLAIPACAGIFILAPQIITVLFGSVFLPAARMMRILSPLIIIWSFSNVLGYQMLLVTGNERISIFVYSIAVIGMVVLDYLLIPVFAGNGTALVFVMGELIVNTYLVHKVHNLILFSIPYRALGQALISTGIMGICVYYFIQIANTPFMQCVVGVVTGIIAYGIINLLLKNELALSIISRLKRGK